MHDNILKNIFLCVLKFSFLVNIEEYSEEAQKEKVHSIALSFLLFNEETVYIHYSSYAQEILPVETFFLNCFLTKQNKTASNTTQHTPTNEFNPAPKLFWHDTELQMYFSSNENKVK